MVESMTRQKAALVVAAFWSVVTPPRRLLHRRCEAPGRCVVTDDGRDGSRATLERPAQTGAREAMLVLQAGLYRNRSG